MTKRTATIIVIRLPLASAADALRSIGAKSASESVDSFQKSLR